MALEDCIIRLARAVESNGEASAVQEIIRQRDQALKDLQGMTSGRDFYHRRSEEAWVESIKKDRRIASLQGVITRMKNKKKAQEQHD